MDLTTISPQWTPAERLKVISHLTAHSDSCEDAGFRYGINSTIRIVATRSAEFLEEQRPALRDAFKPGPDAEPAQRDHGDGAISC